MIFSEVSAKTGNLIQELFQNNIYEQIAEKFKLKATSAVNNAASLVSNHNNVNEETKEGSKAGDGKSAKNIRLTDTEESLEEERNRKKCCK